MTMQAFIMHIGHPGNVDVRFTITQKRKISEIVSALPESSPERRYFETDAQLNDAFPSGTFNCWGVPSSAAPSFNRTRIGDLVLFVPWIGIHDGGVHHAGFVKAKSPISCLAASRVLWPETPYDRLYPLIFFFETETGYRGWFEFLEDLGYHPNGWYRRLKTERFAKFGGPEGYVHFLRSECGFLRAAG